MVGLTTSRSYEALPDRLVDDLAKALVDKATEWSLGDFRIYVNYTPNPQISLEWKSENIGRKIILRCRQDNANRWRIEDGSAIVGLMHGKEMYAETQSVSEWILSETVPDSLLAIEKLFRLANGLSEYRKPGGSIDTELGFYPSSSSIPRSLYDWG